MANNKNSCKNRYVFDWPCSIKNKIEILNIHLLILIKGYENGMDLISHLRQQQYESI